MRIRSDSPVLIDHSQMMKTFSFHLLYLDQLLPPSLWENKKKDNIINKQWFASFANIYVSSYFNLYSV